MSDETVLTSAPVVPPAIVGGTAPSTAPGWKTSEFWLKVAAMVLTALFASGVIPTAGIAAMIAAIAATMLGALGYTVSRTLVKTAGVMLLFGMFASTQISCATVKAVPGIVEHAVIDCTKQDATKLLALALTFAEQAVQHAMAGAAIDWNGLEAQAEAEGTSIGSCAYVATLAALHPKPPTTDPVPAIAARSLMSLPDPALVALEKLRAKSGGVTWQLTSGSW